MNVADIFPTIPFGLITPGKTYYVETITGSHLAIRAMDFPRPTKDGLAVTARTNAGADDIEIALSEVKAVRAA